MDAEARAGSRSIESHPFAARVRRVLAARASLRLEPKELKPAAVLVALFAGPDGAPRVWLLRRLDTMRSHSGQVALPGGRRDPGDSDLVATALREAEEEIGLAPAAVEVLGVGDDFNTSTGYVVTPVVGWLNAPFEPTPNPTEVGRVFSAPFEIFADEGFAKAIPCERLRRLVLTWRVDGEIVWGATARMLSAVAKRVVEAQP
jgi:8-oxo-dGTP pyrophosphatase MutT (NUDIX family)